MRATILSIALLGAASVLALGCSDQPVEPVEGLSFDRANDVVTVCHKRGLNWVFVPTDVDAASLPGHLEHGDGEPGDEVPGLPKAVFLNSCFLSAQVNAVVDAADALTPLFGPALPGGGVTGPTADAGLACAPLAADLTGKIAVIERGACFFSIKVFNAQKAGAIAAIVYNSAAGGDNIVLMAAGNKKGGIKIPSVFVGRSDGLAIVGSVPTSVTIDLLP